MIFNYFFVHPANTEIKYIRGHWYLYERSNVYDPKLGRSRKKSGKILGSITEHGLVPSRARRERVNPVLNDVVEIGAVNHIYQRTEWMRGSIRSYMQEMVAEHERFLLFDGHRILSASHTVDNAEWGYDSKMRYKPQINLLYMFTMGGEIGYPVYYKQDLGSTLDVSAFSDILKESTAYADNRNISYKDLAQTFIKIKAGKIDGKWVVCPIKKSVQRLCGKMQFDPNDLSELRL